MAGTLERGSGRRFDRMTLALEALAGAGLVAVIIGKSFGPVSTILFTLAAAAVAASAWFVYRMIASLSDASLDLPGKVYDTERERLEQEKWLILQGLRELDSDMAIGKVDAADYQQLRDRAVAQGAAIIQRLKELDRRWAEEAERVAAQKLGLKPATSAPALAPAPVAATAWPPALAALFDDRPVAFTDLTCAACSTRNEADARFCQGCGRPREGAPA